MRSGRLVALAFATVAGCAPGSQAPIDGGIAGDAANDGLQIGSRCSVTGPTMTCTSHTAQIGGRVVTYEVPLGTPPAAGWPSVVYYQGSFIPGSRAFTAATTDIFGQYELTSTVAALLDRGYAVIAPNAQNNGSSFWQTNVPPYATNWAGCDDDLFIRQLIVATTDGTFGPLDATRRYAMGISSGGFMTSRMAVSYAGTFRALAIASGSYATCSNSCSVPALPTEHPPTVFLHGDADSTVPVSSMTPYRDQLVVDGHVVETVIHAGAGHEWLPEGKTAIPEWFDAH